MYTHLYDAYTLMDIHIRLEQLQQLRNELQQRVMSNTNTYIIYIIYIMYTHLYEYIYYVYTLICIYTCMFVCMGMRVDEVMSNTNVYVMYTHSSMYIYTLVCMRVYVSMLIYI